MALRNIVKEGDPILRKKCRPVDEVTDRIRILLDDMVETMRQAEGVGLAAPQVGVMRRLFVIQPEPDKTYEFINPEILESEGEQEFTEGCLSVPGYIGEVIRPTHIRVRAMNRDNEMFEMELDGLGAVAFCHENDHLDGILYVDKAKDVREPEPEPEEGEETEN